MFLGIGLAFLCWTLRTVSSTSPSTRISSLEAEVSDLKSKIQTIRDTERPQLDEVTGLHAELQSVSTSLASIRRYASLLSFGQVSGALVSVVAMWSQIIPWWRANTISAQASS